MQEIANIEDNIKGVMDLTKSDIEMDEIATTAMTTFNDLMSLGMNVDARAAAPIFEAASKLIGHAVAAKTSKIDKKLKLMDLELKRRRLEHQISMDNFTNGKSLENDIEGSAKVLDRNELLNLIKKGNSSDASN